MCIPPYHDERDTEVEEVPRDDGEEDGSGDGEGLEEEVGDEDAAEDLRVVAVFVAGEDEAQLLGVLDVLRELDVLHLLTAEIQSIKKHHIVQIPKCIKASARLILLIKFHNLGKHMELECEECTA